jgi:DNA-binding NarL/FixJ family response regulator
MKKTIVIAEDHTILRAGLRELLSSDPSLEVIGEAANGIEAMQAVERLQPDLLMLDLGMPKVDGLSVLKEMKRAARATRILVLTMHRSEQYILEAFKNGADGYCLKEDSPGELLVAVKSVLAGKSHISSDISGKVLRGYLNDPDCGEAIRPVASRITSREREVIKLVGEGYRTREIAELLCISPKTVEKHRANIMEKLGAHSSVELAVYAAGMGLVVKPKD